MTSDELKSIIASSLACDHLEVEGDGRHWQAVSHLNPFFYMIDGFRHGFFGVSDVSPWTSLAVVGCSLVVVCGLCLSLLSRGYKIRH